MTSLFDAVLWPHDSLKDSHHDGCTEPWIAEAVCALLKAKGGHPTVLETGSFIGTTSAWLALTLQRMGGGTFTACDIDADRQQVVMARLAALALPDVTWTVAGDIFSTLAAMPDRSLDFVWLDDDHQKHHVSAELGALWPKMKPQGIIAMHDVWGVCDLQTVCKTFGGVALDLPRLGPAGGLGIIQVPR